MKKNTVFLIYMGIILCLVFITKATFALVNIEEDVPINGTEVKIQLLEAKYQDTSNISIVNSRVGDSLTKVFYIKNLANEDIYYNINLVDVANSFVNPDDLVFTLKSEDGAYISQTTVPTTNITLASAIKINKGQEHKYVLNINFLDTGKNQFDNEFKTFFAKLNIVTFDNKTNEYDDNSIYKMMENSVYGNEGVIEKQNNIAAGVFKTNSTTTGTTVFYYRGNDQINNYVVLGNYCYRMIRTTESFDVKMIYSGEYKDGVCDTSNQVVEKLNQFSKNSNYNAYVGYMYGSASSNDYKNEHQNMSSSSIKIYLDSWYNTNLELYKDFISNEGVYCSNRKPSSFDYNKVSFTNNGYANTTSGYIMMHKYLNNTLNLVCENENDRFSALETYGNGELSSSIGLVTLDELYYAGFIDSPNNNYLYSSDSYWTMTPAYFSNGNAYNFVVNKNKINQQIVSKESGIRPVIIIKGNTNIINGEGRADNPYILND